MDGNCMFDNLTTSDLRHMKEIILQTGFQLLCKGNQRGV